MRWLLLGLASCGQDVEFHDLVPEMALAPPSPLDFGPVVIGESASVDLYVSNTGKKDLTVALSVDPVGEFSFPEAAFTVPVDGSHTVPVTFAPAEIAPFSATLWLETDDPEQPLVPFALVGLGRAVPVPEIAACDDHDFGAVPVGGSVDFICPIRNDGEAPLLLGAVSQVGSGAFTLATDPSDSSVSVGGINPVIVRYTPATDAGDSGELRFASNDADEPEVVVQLTGNGGSTVAYPEARIAWGEPGTAPTLACPATASPVADLPLTGEASTDPLGGGLTWLWTVADAPTGAQGTLNDPEIPSPAIHLDVAGEWSVALQVEAIDGTRSAPARCLISAIPEEDIRVELSWDGPTSDLDVHLADAPETPFYSVPGDVSPCNAAPAWGASLDQDDADGYGPEAITVGAAATGTYPVRVHYFQRNADFSVTATVNVWLDGALAFSGSAPLDYNEVWEVGVVNWPAGTFGVSAGNPRIADARQCD